MTIIARLQDAADKSRAVDEAAMNDFRAKFSLGTTVQSDDPGCLAAVPDHNVDHSQIAALWQARVAANDNSRLPLMIGITGKRNVGKSTVATLLESKFGFCRAHAFDGGKEAAFGYFWHITGDSDTARRMVYGDLKDVPSAHLPGNVAPRFFLEKFGHFMGVDMGVEWTLAMEINRLRRESQNAPIVVESLVYEAPWFKAAGGYVLRLERPEHEGPQGIASDGVQALIEADAVISARTVDELEDKVMRLFASITKEQEARRWVG